MSMPKWVLYPSTVGIDICVFWMNRNASWTLTSNVESNVARQCFQCVVALTSLQAESCSFHIQMCSVFQISVLFQSHCTVFLLGWDNPRFGWGSLREREHVHDCSHTLQTALGTLAGLHLLRRSGLVFWRNEHCGTKNIVERSHGEGYWTSNKGNARVGLQTSLGLFWARFLVEHACISEICEVFKVVAKENSSWQFIESVNVHLWQ